MRLQVSLLAIGLLSSSGGIPAQGRLDHGLLDPGWFGSPVEFRNTVSIDYLWVRPGLTLKGKTLQVGEWDPPMLPEYRNDKNRRKAEYLTEEMPGWMRVALELELSGVAKVGRTAGEILVTGRFVDCNRGNQVAKELIGFGAGSATATWDLRFVDKKSGEVLVAVHHRTVSGSALTQIDDKILRWLAEFAKLAKLDFAIFASGKVAAQ